MEITVNQAITAHREGRLEEAERLYRSILENHPTTLNVYNNLGVLMQELGRFDEAEISYKKAIELKPDYVDAHSNLAVVLKDLNKFDEAEASYRKAIELKPNYVDAHKGLDLILREKDLLLKIFQKKKAIGENKVSSYDSIVGLTSNPFITHRDVETKFLKDLYKSKLKELNKTKDARYGNGRCTDFKFFKNDFSIIKNIEADLIDIMKQAVKSDIHIFDSFLNIYGPESGSNPHDHITSFDKNQKLVNQKYSLNYYLSVGDQNCIEPGNLRLYDPSKEIRVTEGMVVIIPAYRKHSSVYNGRKDRIMIGVNFYSLI